MDLELADSLIGFNQKLSLNQIYLHFLVLRLSENPFLEMRLLLIIDKEI